MCRRRDHEARTYGTVLHLMRHTALCTPGRCRAATCNLVEASEAPLRHKAQSVRLPLAPFEIATVKVWF
jgi:hypothetical protein